MIKFTIPLPAITKKNHQQIRKSFRTGARYVAQSDQYTQYEQDAMWFIPRHHETIDYPVTVKCLFYMPTRRKVDKTNLEAAIHDILVKARLLADDNRDIIASTDGTRVYYDKDSPRTEVYITPFEEEGYELWSEKTKKKGKSNGRRKAD